MHRPQQMFPLGVSCIASQTSQACDDMVCPYSAFRDDMSYDQTFVVSLITGVQCVGHWSLFSEQDMYC